MLSKKDIVASGPFLNYISKAQDADVIKSIRHNTKAFEKLLKHIPPKKRKYAYAEGKWTIKELLQHVIDAERVFTYRAVTFSRKDGTQLPGFDENNWAANAQTAHRSWLDLVKEFKALRKATECLFESFTEDQLLATGTASSHPINALALGFICAGHVAHHMQVLRERYL